MLLSRRAAADLAGAKPRRQNVDSGKNDRNWDRELTVRGTSLGGDGSKTGTVPARGLSQGFAVLTATAFMARKLLGQPRVYCKVAKTSAINANGMTNADVCTRRFFNQIDFFETYPNPLTNGMLQSCKIPGHGE